jgi:hypothetical protein
MGCKQSDLREDGTVINPDHLPPVPAGSWYGQPYDGPEVQLSPFHERHRGLIPFNTEYFPTSNADLARLPNREPRIRDDMFCLGVDSIYGMAYLHSTALFTEYSWRSRVTHDAPSGKFEKPFYDTLMGIKVSVDGVQIPDSAPTAESLPQCTATLRAHEAVEWRAVPVILFPDPNHFTMRHSSLYYGLVQSFCMLALTLREGSRHKVDVEVCYGCKAEAEFCTDFIAEGSFELAVMEGAQSQVREVLETARRGLANVGMARTVPLTYQEQPGSCNSCGQTLQHACTACCAPVCGNKNCTTVIAVGYPQSCPHHLPIQ